MWATLSITFLLVTASVAAADSGVHSISSSCGGGAGGGGFGVVVERGGEITRWNATSFFADPDEDPMRSDPQLSGDLFAELSEIGFEKIEYAKKGDMTCKLSLRAGDQSHEVSWSMGDPDAPARVLQIARRIRALVGDPAYTTLPSAAPEE